MKIIAFIEELDVIEKILRHLDLWDVRNHDPPQKISDYILELVCDKADSMIPVFSDPDFYLDLSFPLLIQAQHVVLVSGED